MSFRQRGHIRSKNRFTVEEDEGDDDITSLKRLATAAPKQKSKKKEKAAATSKLSFGDDDADIVYAARKSKSRGVAVQGIPATVALRPKASGASYSQEDLAELRSTNASTSQERSKSRQPLNDSVIRISGSFVTKPREGVQDIASAMPDSFRSTIVEPSRATGMPLPPPPLSSLGKSHGPRWDRGHTDEAAAVASGSVRAIASTGYPRASSEANVAPESAAEETDHFPDARMIQLAKQKRERLRHASMAPDYIPSESGVFRGVAEYKKVEDAIKKGSDDDRSDDEQEDDMRIQFSGTRTRAEVKPKATLHDLQAQSASESDDDDFALAQQRRAMAASLHQRVSDAAVRNSHGGASNSSPAPNPDGAHTHSASQAIAGVNGTAQSASEAGAQALKNIEQHVAKLQERSARTRSNLVRTRSQMQAKLSQITDQEAAFDALGVRYIYLQQIRVFLRDLCACLQHKVADIEALEEERSALMIEFASKPVQSRDRISQELMAPAVAALKALDAFGQGFDKSKAAELAERAAARAEESALEQACRPQLDEFGRDENAYARDAAKQRQTSRRAAIEALQARLSQDSGASLLTQSALVEAAMAGHSPDADSAYYRRKVAELGEIADSVFSDAHEDFATLGAVVKRLGAFRERFPAAYQQAYISESLPALLSVYVRQQLLLYDPLHCNGISPGEAVPAGVTSFMEHDWFKALAAFGEDGGPDENLIPSLVSKVVMDGKLKSVVQTWDPANSRDAATMKDLVSDLLVFATDGNATDFAKFVDVVKQKLADAVEAFEPLPQWPMARIAASPRLAVAAAWLWSEATTFLTSICAFRGLLNANTVHELALKRLLNTRILPALQVIASEAAAGDQTAVATTLMRLHAITKSIGAKGSAGAEDLEPVKKIALSVLQKGEAHSVQLTKEHAASVRQALGL